MDGRFVPTSHRPTDVEALRPVTPSARCALMIVDPEKLCGGISPRRERSQSMCRLKAARTQLHAPGPDQISAKRPERAPNRHSLDTLE